MCGHGFGENPPPFWLRVLRLRYARPSTSAPLRMTRDWAFQQIAYEAFGARSGRLAARAIFIY
jgi:hypothetical protein